jgi:uncharacterized protein YmfQ (DUF2313 family)
MALIGRTTDEDYLQVLQQLLPSGAAWPREPDATLTKVLRAQAAELARIHNRTLDLLEEADPRTTNELLADWERVAGLPDECTAGRLTTLQERRLGVVSKLQARGGQSRAYFLMLATSLGYDDVEITEYRPFTCGISRCGDQLGGDAAARFVWRVKVLGPRATRFKCGESRCGDSLCKISRAEDLECIFRRSAPAHTNLRFSYEGA